MEQERKVDLRDEDSQKGFAARLKKHKGVIIVILLVAVVLMCGRIGQRNAATHPKPEGVRAPAPANSAQIDANKSVMTGGVKHTFAQELPSCTVDTAGAVARKAGEQSLACIPALGGWRPEADPQVQAWLHGAAATPVGAVTNPAAPYPSGIAASSVGYGQQRSYDSVPTQEAIGGAAISADSDSVVMPRRVAADVATDSTPEHQAPAAQRETPASTGDTKATKPDPNGFGKYTGPLYRIMEGTFIPCTLGQKLNGALSGGMDCRVSEDVLSFDHTHVLIRQGSVLLGELAHVTSTGQERLFVAFHRGYDDTDGFPFSLDQFQGFDQIGEAGLREKVNHHYLQIFGATVAIASVGALANVGNYGGGGLNSYSVGDQYRSGFTMGMADSSMQVLNRFLNILPTFTISEGARIQVRTENDLLLPDVNNHRMPKDL